MFINLSTARNNTKEQISYTDCQTKEKFQIVDQSGNVKWEILTGNQGHTEIWIYPHPNYFTLKASFSLRTNVRLPSDAYLLDFWIGDNKIENISIFTENVDLLTTEVDIPLNTENIFTKLSHSEKIPVRAELKLNENSLNNLNFKVDEVDKLKSRIKENKMFYNKNIMFSNYEFINNILSGTIYFTKNMNINTIKEYETYFTLDYRYSFEETIPKKRSIKNIIYLLQKHMIDWDSAYIQYNFNYYVNTSSELYKFSIETNQYEQKSFIDKTLTLPTGLKYNYETKSFEKGNYETGFYLPEGGYGYLLTIIDFKNENGIPQKIIWKQPFKFQSFADQIKDEKIFTIGTDKILSLENFYSKKGEVNEK